MPKKTDLSNASKMRFALVTRHLNRSGYACLKALIEEGFYPQALVVSNRRPALVTYWRPIVLWWYRLKCWFYRCHALRVVQSEEFLARKKGIDVLAIDSLKSQPGYDVIAGLDLDLLVVAGGWHEKIPTAVLSLPRMGSINVHPSLLPEFRGTSVTRWQVLEGVKTSGVTIHEMDGEFDSGRTLSQSSVNVPPNITPQKLFQVIADRSGPLLIDVMRRIVHGSWGKECTFRGDKRYRKYYKKWKWNRELLIIDPNDHLASIGRKILSATQESYEYPGALLRLNGRKFIIRRVIIESPYYRKSGIAAEYNICVWEGEYLRWERPNEDTALLITNIQPCEPKYFLRRSGKPNRFLSFPKSIEITAA